MSGLLTPGSHRAARLADDRAVLTALLRVETAWARVLAQAGAVPPEQAEAVERTAAVLKVDLNALAAATEAAGNPVVPLLAVLREACGDAAPAVHRGLTSQDVMDSALMLIGRASVARVRADLVTAGDDLAARARLHRDDVTVARTLSQWAVPTTFGLRCAQWLTGIGEAVTRLDTLVYPVQYGGAGGTRALGTEITSRADQSALAETFAALLGLSPAGIGWHTRRAAVTGIGDALTRVTDALGVVANGTVLLGRPEIGEVREGRAPGRGGSSTMPHKQNPVLGILIRSAALQAPALAHQLHAAAAGAVDERPDGSWHAEWPVFTRLCELTAVAASQAADLVPGLVVDVDRMRERAHAAGGDLLSERGPGSAEPGSYLGEASLLVDAAVTAWQAVRDRRR